MILKIFSFLMFSAATAFSYFVTVAQMEYFFSERSYSYLSKLYYKAVI